MARTITLGTVDPTRFPDWDERIAAHPEATVFHTAAWARVLSESYGYLPKYFTAMDKGNLCALLPFMEIRSWITGTRGVSLPFTDECAQILPEGMDCEDAVRPVIALAESRGWKTFELRGCGNGMRNIPSSVEYLTHELDLSRGVEVLFSSFYPNVQRNLRKAEREGVSVSEDHTSKGMLEFYRLNCRTRRMHGLPPQPIRFFENIREHILLKRLGTLLLARHEDKVVAAAIYLHFAGKAVFKYGASDIRYQELRANNLVFREGIRTLCLKGNRLLSFGRTDLHHDGLRQFKLSWGAIEKRLKYVKYDLRSKSYLSADNHRGIDLLGKTISNLPLPFLRMIGRIAYRHVG